MAKVKSFELSEICDSGSKLNIFTLFERLNVKELKEIEETQPQSFNLRRLFMPKQNYELQNDDSKSNAYQTLLNKLESFNSMQNKQCNSEACFCEDLFRKIETQSQLSKQFFSLIKPLIVGKILYAPNTSAAHNKLIERMNTTFENMNQIANLFQKIALLSNQTLVQLSLFEGQVLSEFKQNLHSALEFSTYAK